MSQFRDDFGGKKFPSQKPGNHDHKYKIEVIKKNGTCLQYLFVAVNVGQRIETHEAIRVNNIVDIGPGHYFWKQ